MPGQILTFYAYKGGTGRTMALANVAVMLTRERRARVLMVDWDLEAPGLHRFFESDNSDGDGDAQPGVIELFATARDRLSSGDSTSELWRDLPLDDYIQPTSVSQQLSLMRAGRLDEEYPRRVNTFDWESFYEAAPGAFADFAGTLAERFDYVLIDSRTGISDTSGICTMLLPERLVLVFTPNQQSLTGVLDLARRATSYRHRSDDLRPLLVFPLASRVELSEEELRHEWREGTSGNGTTGRRLAGYQPMFERLFEDVYDLPDCNLEHYFDEVQIQQVPRFAYGEQIAALEETRSDRLSLTRSYGSFTRALIDSAGPWTVTPQRQTVKQERDELGHSVSREVGDQIWWLHSRLRRMRRRQIIVRVAQALVVLAAVLIIAILLTYEDDYYRSEWLPTFVLGTSLAGILEAGVRAWAPVSARNAMARTAAALSKERRLYDAGAGPYAETEFPAALLAERCEQLLDALNDMLLVRSTWRLSGDEVAVQPAAGARKD
jgi:cellulose biosynthesis protein BcsQ